MDNIEQQALKKLADLRTRIDALDESIVQLLLDRSTLIHQVGALKAAHWPADCHIRSGREGQMHRAIAKRFMGTDIPPAVALAIWRQLIGAATQLESPLRVATLAGNPHHLWLAREYFGVEVRISTHADIDAALKAIAQKQCNIVLLPPPTNTIWRDAQMLHAAGLSLFASLPVTTQPLPNGALGALAFAAITPEPSGDDISYFLRDGNVETIDEFQSMREHAVFLGAHPRPVQL